MTMTETDFLARVKSDLARAEPYGLGYSWWVIRELLKLAEEKETP